MGTALIPADQVVSLAKLWHYSARHKEMMKRRKKFFRLYDSSIALAGTYLEDMEEAQTILRLRRDIRMATRGTPTTIEQDSCQIAGYISMQTESLYNAQSYMVKDAWRKIAPLVHPDRRGGNTELFQSALAAYRLKDLTFLQDLYVQLHKDNIFWRCSADADYYLQTELDRPGVSTQRLRTKPEYQIVMLHQSGKPELAREFARMIARKLITMLQAELHYLHTGELPPQENQNGNQESSPGNGNPEEESRKIHTGNDGNPDEEGSGQESHD
jgi:hypothetical protein